MDVYNKLETLDDVENFEKKFILTKKIKETLISLLS